MEPIEPRIGQVWKNRRNKPSTIFVVTRIWAKAYAAKGAMPAVTRTRVTGLLTSGEDCLQLDRDLDLDSLRNMFPYLLFDPPQENTGEPQ